MFDVIGKRRIFYAISLALTIPGLVFILLTPFTDAGLQFTIDYTGGTRWEIKFEDPAVTPEQVVAVFEENGLDATALSTSTGFIEIKTEPIGLQPAPAPTAEPSASPSASAGASGSPAPSASRPRPLPPPPVRPRPRRPARPCGATGNTDLPTDGSSPRWSWPSRTSSGRSRRRRP